MTDDEMDFIIFITEVVQLMRWRIVSAKHN